MRRQRLALLAPVAPDLLGRRTNPALEVRAQGGTSRLLRPVVDDRVGFGSHTEVLSARGVNAVRRAPHGASVVSGDPHRDHVPMMRHRDCATLEDMLQTTVISTGFPNAA